MLKVLDDYPVVIVSLLVAIAGFVCVYGVNEGWFEGRAANGYCKSNEVFVIFAGVGRCVVK